MKKLKVLVSAYACEPGKGSEPGVGWNWVKQIARFHEVWVITRANNREPIEKAWVENPSPNVHWVFFDLPRWMRFWKKGQRGVHAYYYLWQIGGLSVVWRLHRRIGFDLVHHLTFGSAWLPSFLCLLPVPFIWGPVGGVEPYPKEFLRMLSFRSLLFEELKLLAQAWGRIDPFTARTMKCATLMLAQTPETVRYFPRAYRAKTRLFPAVGISLDEMEEPTTPTSTLPFRVVSVGRLVHFKGFDLGLESFAELSMELADCEYHIIGDGPMKYRLQRYALELGVAQRVTFLDMLPRKKLLALLREYDVLLYPGLREPPISVIVEAMAAGLPVICLDLGGPALQVTDETGIKVPADTPQQAVQGITEALSKLAHDPGLRARMGEAARRRVADHFCWDRKGEWISQIYDHARDDGAVNPKNSGTHVSG